MLPDEDLVDNTTELVRPVNFVVDQGLSDDRARHMVRIAQLRYTFWNTGLERFLAQAVDTSFVDRTLPPGRPQGPPGPVAASAGFRSAVPDLTCELSDLLMAGDKAAVRQLSPGEGDLSPASYAMTRRSAAACVARCHTGPPGGIPRWQLRAELAGSCRRRRSRAASATTQIPRAPMLGGYLLAELQAAARIRGRLTGRDDS
jgi:SnoaL-like polyketide cyclase